MKPLLLSLSFLFLFSTQLAFAQNEVVVSSDRIEDGFIKEEFGFIPCNGPDCSTCHIVALVNTIVKWLIGIIFIFFAVIAVYAGFEMVMSGGNPGALSNAKSKFTNAFIGLFIVLAAWLLVDTLLKGLLKGGDGIVRNADFTYGPWSNIQCVGQYDPDIIEAESISGTPAAANPGGTGVTPSGNLVSYGGARFDAAVVDKIKYIDENFNLRVSGGYRDPARNAQVGGSPNSYHLTGRAGDFVGPITEMRRARDWARANGAREALIHNAGSGMHLHVAW